MLKVLVCLIIIIILLIIIRSCNCMLFWLTQSYLYDTNNINDLWFGLMQFECL